MIPPGLFPGLIRPGMQQQPPPGSTEAAPESASQPDAGDKDKPTDGDDKKEESTEENATTKGMVYIAVYLPTKGLEM